MNKRTIRIIISLLVLILLIPCIGFAQDDNAQDADRYQYNQRTVETQGQEIPVYYPMHTWSQKQHQSQVRMEPCEQMLERTWFEQDSILHNCPEHKLVMLYKCPQCQATSLERVHKCVDK